MSEEDFIPEEDYRKLRDPNWAPEELSWDSLNQKNHAVLDESGNVIPATFLEWARWFESSQQRFIQYDLFLDGKFFVSTVFMGLNHQYSPHPNAPPQWFETMVFGEEREEDLFGRKTRIRPSLWCERCATLAEAKEQHARGVTWLKAAHLEGQ
jgi:hypothetical protein